jgi:hypothetical protein
MINSNNTMKKFTLLNCNCGDPHCIYCSGAGGSDFTLILNCKKMKK